MKDLQEIIKDVRAWHELVAAPLEELKSRRNVQMVLLYFAM